MHAYAQTDTRPVKIAIHANSIERPTDGVDLGTDKEKLPISASGNVSIEINGVLVKADSAFWIPGSHTIELNGGSVRVELPSRSTAVANLP